MLNRPPEPLVEVHQRRVAQQPLRLRDVRERVWHVAGGRGGVSPLEAAHHDRLELRDDLEKAHAASAADVEHLARHRGRLGRQYIRFDHVVDVSEVTRLGAVAVNLERPAGEPPQDEAGDHRSVLRLRVLPRAEHVEVAEPHRLDAVETGPDGRILLARRLGRRVRRDRRRRLVFALREIRAVAVDRRRRRVDHARNPAAPGGLQHVERAVDVVRVRTQRVLHRTRHRPHRRLVEDHAGAARGAEDHRQVADVPAEHLEVVPEARREPEVGARARREVVENAHARAVREEPLDEVRADETGAARHEREVAHAAIVSSPTRATRPARCLTPGNHHGRGGRRSDDFPRSARNTRPEAGHGASMTTERRSGTLSVIVPVLNEEGNIPELVRRLKAVLDGGRPFDVIFVDDGSTDRTPQILRALHTEDPRIKAIHLTRTFGHQASISAGLQAATGDAVVVMDGDLQDAPEVVPQFVTRWLDGDDVVYAIRQTRQASWLKRTAYHAFYRLLARISAIDLPLDSGDFSLMDRRVVDVLNAMPERTRFVRGMRRWAGFRQRLCRAPEPTGSPARPSSPTASSCASPWTASSPFPTGHCSWRRRSARPCRSRPS